MSTFIGRTFQLPGTWALLGLSLLSIALSFARFWVTERTMYLFLNWNLLLAFLPWLFAAALPVLQIKNRWLAGILLVLWLLFYPNAPYILTDFIHLGAEPSAPLWYDLLLISSYTLTGLAYAAASLGFVRDYLTDWWGKTPARLGSFAVHYLAAFGIYLGRFLRWNSWDVVSDPGGLFGDILGRFTAPMNHPRTWAFVAILGTLLFLVDGFYGASRKPFRT